jgi:signal peptidase
VLSPTRVRRWGFIVPIGVLGLVLLAPLAAMFATMWVLGWRFQPVTTSSMAPLYPAGTLVAVEPIDASLVSPGMVIVFRDTAGPDRLVAHRVVRRLPGEPPSWQTQGDANRTVDPWPVSASDVRGRVRWGVPSLGTAVSALTGWQGAVILVGGPLALLAIAEAASYRRNRQLSVSAASTAHDDTRQARRAEAV